MPETTVSSIYSDGGGLSSWGQLVEKSDPLYGERFFDLLKSENILPSNFSGYKFLSLSANRGTREIGLIKKVNSEIDSTKSDIQDKPTFILSDISYDVLGKVKVSGYRNVNTVFVNSDAENIPVSNNSINLMFDRMGATWHKSQNLIENSIKVNGKMPDWQIDENRTEMDSFLMACKSKLAVGGSLVLDYPERSSGDPISTLGYLEKLYEDVFDSFARLNFNFKVIGSGEERFVLLTRK